MGLYLCHAGDVNITASRFFVTNVYLHPNVVTLKDNLAQVLKDLRTSKGYSQEHSAYVPYNELKKATLSRMVIRYYVWQWH
jgi:hypothetical protein